MESKERNSSEAILDLISLVFGIIVMWVMVLNDIFSSIIPYSSYLAIAVTVLVVIKVIKKFISKPSGGLVWKAIRPKYQNQFTLDVLVLSFLTGYAII